MDGEQPGSPSQQPGGTGNSFVIMLAEATTLSWNLVVPIVGGVLLGRYLDDRFGEDVTWTLSLLALGVLVVFNNLYTMYVEHGDGETLRERIERRVAARQEKEERDAEDQ